MDILTPDSDTNYNIDELVGKIKGYDFFTQLNIATDSYSLITTVKIPDNIKLVGAIKMNFFSMYLWLETDHNILLCGFHNSPLKGWYKIKREHDIKLLMEYFDNREKVYYNTSRFYIDTKHDFLTILNYVKNSYFTGNNIYTDEKDEVGKINNNKLTELDDANILSFLIQTNIDEFYVYTKFSNSKIKFENHEGFIVVELNYNQLKLRNRYDPSDKFMPSDISLLLNFFDIKSMNDILSKKELTAIEIDVCILLAKDKRNLNKLKNKLDEIKKEHPEINNYIDSIIDRIKCDELFIQMENDGIFRSFENSVDILIKTIYERIEESKCTDYSYVNEILKYKINNMFFSKLL